MAPKISVLMGIYNCAATLPAAIECILNQTVQDFELIMCEDGSKDDTYRVAREYQQKYPDQIVLLQNEKNMGLNATLNRCLAVARGSFISRMDGDDLCAPDRFEKELAAFEETPEYAIVSCAMTYFDENGTWGCGRVNPYPQPVDMIRSGAFCHAACMVRAEAYQAVGGYTEDEKYLRVEDYDLWVKMYALGYRGRNLSEALYHMRDDRSATARRNMRGRINEARVAVKAIRILKLPRTKYIHVLRPILVGLLPMWLYEKLHKKHLKDKPC
jgi:glycosyltransferase EpsE